MNSYKSNIFLVIGSIGVLLLSFGLSARHFMTETRYIPSTAMAPTLQIGDRLIINKLIYRFSEPQRGDIIVFLPPQTLKDMGYKEDFIKRIIGIPGDRVRVEKDQVSINGQKLKENYLDTTNLSKGIYGQDFGAQLVPANSYLVLGDNRANSFDGRYWGFVHRENIIGQAVNRYYPFDRAGAISKK